MESSSARVVTVVEIGRMPPSGPVAPIQVWEPGECKWERRDLVPDHVALMLSFPVNKGQPLQPKDVHYMHDNNILYAEKSNGVSGRCVVYEGTAWLATDHVPPQFYYAGNVHYANQPTIRIQVEFIDGPPIRVVVLEVVSAGYNCPQGFRGRLNYSQQLLRDSPQAKSLFEYKLWYASWDDVCDKARNEGWEGVVMMTNNCPPPAQDFTRGMRYVKFNYTYDVERDGAIWEVDRQGTPIRPRPDKKAANNPEAIRWARDAVDFDGFDVLMKIPFDSERIISILSRDPWTYTYEENAVLLKYPFAPLPPELKVARKDFYSYISRTELWEKAIHRVRSIVDSKESDNPEVLRDYSDVKF